MDQYKKALKGSPSRDIFKHLHKDLKKDFYALDLDFIFVSKYPPGIVAFIDVKLKNDEITFSEVLAYEVLKKIAPIFICEAKILDNIWDGIFDISLYIKGDYKPFPKHTYELKPIETTENWKQFGIWEGKIRNAYKINSKK